MCILQLHTQAMYLDVSSLWDMNYYIAAVQQLSAVRTLAFIMDELSSLGFNYQNVQLCGK